MWLAADPISPTWGLVTTVLGGIFTLAAAVSAAWFALRGTTRTAANQRELAFDAQVDADRKALREERDRLREQLDAAVASRDEFRERYAALRFGVRAAGLDPDELGKGVTSR